MKKFILIIGAVIIAAAIAAGSFYGGMAYQRNQVNSVRDRFLRERGLEGAGPGSGGFPGAGQNGAGGPGGGFFGRGITGQLKSVGDSVLTLSTPQNDITVTLSEHTRIEKTSTGALADLQPGQQVMVTGERDSDGNITAIQVMILYLPTTETTP